MKHIGILAHSAEGSSLCYLTCAHEGAKHLGEHFHPEITMSMVAMGEAIDAWEAAITPQTKYLFVETPSNPSLFIADIPALAALAKAKGLPLVVDNTITTPALQQPNLLGADLVVHSTTKYICGNATSLGGIICGPRDIVYMLQQSFAWFVHPKYLQTTTPSSSPLCWQPYE